MVAKPETSYTGQIDWNAVYRAHYQIEDIEARVEKLLAGSAEVAFCGFGEVACRLSQRHSVHFIEYSRSMAEAARREFPSIEKISQADVLDAIENILAPMVLVLCRISAYWHSPDCLPIFLQRVQRSSRKLIAVDFFDADRLEGNEALGNLAFSDVRTAAQRESRGLPEIERPSVLLATVYGRYRVGDIVSAFSETRAFYRPTEVLEFARHQLGDYEVSLERPVIDSDPGFTLVARWRPSSDSGRQI